MPNKRQPVVIGIAGGTGSGKSTVASVILKRVGAKHIALLPHDAYYRELHMLPVEERQRINFDHPDSLETDLLVEHVKQLKAGNAIEMPVYDFTTHSRTEKTIPIEPRRIILVEGILIFYEMELRKLFDVKIFVDTDADIRFIRRLQRDIIERGRTTESVIKQYLGTVRPMHMEFVEPTKRYADVIIPEGGLNTVAMDMVIARIESVLNPEESARETRVAE
jgi:uridine kinase